jgi:hypothetical protein
MTKRTVSVDQLYSEGRHFPRGQNRDPQSRQRIPHEPNMTARDQHRNQMPEDQHGPGYDNGTSGWVRGARGEPTMQNETAANYPDGNFDRGNSWRLGREKSLNWHSGSDPAIIRKPGPNTPNR